LHHLRFRNLSFELRHSIENLLLSGFDVRLLRRQHVAVATDALDRQVLYA
jgi:hypothetical protein